MRVDRRGRGIATALMALSAACGARSGLLEPLQGEISGAGSGGAAGTSFSGKGGVVGQSGTFSTGGKLGGAGMPSISGTPGVAGQGQAGEPGVCLLSPSDCATPSEPECSAEREPCLGSLAFFQSVESTNAVYLNDVAPDREGGAAIAGHHVGTTRWRDHVLVSPPTPSQPFGQEAFVAGVSAVGDVHFLYTDLGPEAHGISVKQAADGDVVLQTKHVNATTAATLVRLDQTGKRRWRQELGVSERLVPKSLAVDNDDRIWASGTFFGAFDYPGSTLTTNTTWTGFLLQVDRESALLNAFATTPSDWAYGDTLAIAVDDEDSVLVCGQGDPSPAMSRSYVRKFSRVGELLFEKLYDGALHMKTVVVDRLMRVTVLGDFLRPFSNEGQLFTSDGGVNLWLAQYSREGELLWQKSFGGDAVVDAAAVDPFGNLLVAGYAARLHIGVREVKSQHAAELGKPDFSYVLKLRADGTDVWARTADGQVRWAAIAANGAGQVWLAGSYANRIWLEDTELTSPNTSGLVVRLEP